MKIVVVYATAGAGHKKAARCIADHIGASAHVECRDIIDGSSWLFRLVYLRGYDFLVNHCQWAWSVLFCLTNRAASLPAAASLRSALHYFNTRRFCCFLIEARPDVVVSTHFLSSDVVSYLKAKGILQCRLVTVITDFGVHPFWICAATDVYCCASDATARMLADRGVAPEKIRVTGIPVEPKFSQTHDVSAIRRRLGISPGMKVVLIMTGSFGIGPIEDMTRSLCRGYAVLAVCARNKRLYARMKARAYPHACVFGFVDFIDELMAVADVIITKPGGLTISELLCMECAPLFIAAIPGQETANASILGSAAIGKGVSQPRLIKEQVDECIRDADRIKKSILDFRQTSAAARIYDILRTNSPGCPG
ncbi:MAG: glycosyltransferase [Candidatus Omnitrophica bacterium]|nr:glycosyltransferase [Candidatus Omnitrophota bacterium]